MSLVKAKKKNSAQIKLSSLEGLKMIRKTTTNYLHKDKIASKSTQDNH